VASPVRHERTQYTRVMIGLYSGLVTSTVQHFIFSVSHVGYLTRETNMRSMRENARYTSFYASCKEACTPESRHFDKVQARRRARKHARASLRRQWQ